MAKPKKEESNTEQNIVNGSKETLSTILKTRKEDHYNFEERVEWQISTGSLTLDSYIGGYLSPCLVRICGANNEGKTPQTLEIIRNFLSTVPNSKAFWVIAEGRGLSKENKERCQLKFVYSAEEWEVGTVFVLESNVFELYIKCVQDLVLNNPEKIKYAFIVDSIDGLRLKSDEGKEINEANKVAGAPALSKKMLQSLSLGMFKYGHLMILLSQVTAEIKLNQYEKTPNRGGQFSGGNSLLHGADWIFEYQPSYNGDYILDNPSGKLNDGKSKSIGKWSKVILQKSGVETSRKQLITYPIKFGRKPSGIWLERELVDLLLSWNLLIKAGAWFNFDGDLLSELKDKKYEINDKYHGIDSIYDLLENNKELTQYLSEKFKKLIEK